MPHHRGQALEGELEVIQNRNDDRDLYFTVLLKIYRSCARLKFRFRNRVQRGRTQSKAADAGGVFCGLSADRNATAARKIPLTTFRRKVPSGKSLSRSL